MIFGRYTPYFNPAAGGFTAQETTFIQNLSSEAGYDSTVIPIVSTGSGAPASTPAAEGEIYIDTANDDVYVATGTASSADWTKVNNETLSVLRILEGSAPSAESGYGKVYVKSSDSKLYYKDDSGTEYDLTAAVTGTGITWQEETGTTVAAAVNNGYVLNNAGLVTLTIPDTAPVGSVIEIVGKGAGGWKVAQNAGETIHFGDTDTTTGTGGSLASVDRYDVLRLVCVTANTDWTATSPSNLTIV